MEVLVGGGVKNLDFRGREMSWHYSLQEVSSQGAEVIPLPCCHTSCLFSTAFPVAFLVVGLLSSHRTQMTPSREFYAAFQQCFFRSATGRSEQTKS